MVREHIVKSYPRVVRSPYPDQRTTTGTYSASVGRSAGRRVGRRVEQRVEQKVEQEGDRMSIGKTRGSLYKLARILGDVQAVRKGRVGKRIGRRVVGRYAGRGMGRLFR